MRRLLVVLVASCVLTFAGLMSVAQDRDESQNKYCRIYRTMSMSGNVGCFYCLKCDPPCSGPAAGVLGNLDDPTGSCINCDGGNCFLFRSGAEAPAPPAEGKSATKKRAARTAFSGKPPVHVTKLSSIPPDIQYNPSVTVVKIRRTGIIKIAENGTEREAHVYLICCDVKPKGNGGKDKPPTGHLGFAHEINDDIQDPQFAVEAADVEPLPQDKFPGQYRFKFKQGQTVYDCIAILEVPEVEEE